MFAEAGAPPGVLQVVAGGDEIGEHLVAHPSVRMVHFTGSSEVGREIAKIAGGQLKRFRWSWGATTPWSCSTTPTSKRRP